MTETKDGLPVLEHQPDPLAIAHTANDVIAEQADMGKEKDQQIALLRSALKKLEQTARAVIAERDQQIAELEKRLEVEAEKDEQEPAPSKPYSIIGDIRVNGRKVDSLNGVAS